MARHWSEWAKDGCARFVANLEDGFRSPKGRNGRLVRPRFTRKIAGVCAGLAEGLGWNVKLVRVLAVVLAVASSGLVALAYAAAWVVVPEERHSLTERSVGSPAS